MAGVLGVPQNANNMGLDPASYRFIIDAQFVNAGVIGGLACWGNQNLTYHIEWGVGVSMARNGGKVIMEVPTFDTPAVSAGDASNPRIDCVYVKPIDPTLDGSTKYGVECGVVQGTPAVNPQWPDAPSGTLPLGWFRVNPGVTNLANGSVRLDQPRYAIPYGGSLGILGSGNSYVGGVPVDWQWHPISNFTTRWLPTDRIVELVWSMTAKNPGAGDSIADYAVRVKVDNVVIEPENLIQLPISKFSATQQHTWLTTLTAGTHQVVFEVVGDGNDVPMFDITGGKAYVKDIGVAE